MSLLSRHGSKVGFVLLYLGYVISYVDRAAAFDFLLVMTALAALVATTIRAREPQLVQSLA